MMKHGNKVLARDILTQVRKWTVWCEREGQRFAVSFITQNSKTCFFFQTMEHVKRKQVEKYHKAPEGKKEEIECNPYTIFHQALENCMPVVGLASIQKGGKYYQVSNEAKKTPKTTQQTVFLLILFHQGINTKPDHILFNP